jgi:hypothetical protein
MRARVKIFFLLGMVSCSPSGSGGQVVPDSAAAVKDSEPAATDSAPSVTDSTPPGDASAPDALVCPPDRWRPYCDDDCYYGRYDCPPDRPFCVGFTSDGDARCLAACDPNYGSCYESPPRGSQVPACSMEGPSGCPADRPYCCTTDGLFYCVDHILRGSPGNWRCN